MDAKYPKANTALQWMPGKGGGGTQSRCDKLVLHTTETSSWPGYPSFAPHLTYNPWTHIWRQHFPLTQTASTLADPSSTAVRENRDNVVQVEIIAYCDPKYNAKGRGVDYLDDEAVHDLAAFASWLHKTAGLELSFPSSFLPYPSSYGNSKVRMSGPQFDAAKGIIGHQHVSGNDHGDPGNPPWLSKFLTYARGTTPKPVTTTPKGGLPVMAAADTIRLRNNDDQPLSAGEHPLKIIKGSTDLSVVVGENDGVHAVANIDLRDFNEKAWLVEGYWSIVDYKKGDTKPGSPSIPVRLVPGGNQLSFARDIPKPTADGRSNRLRLVVRVRPRTPVVPGAAIPVVNNVHIDGWKMP